jgi:hypothetical protein
VIQANPDEFKTKVEKIGRKCLVLKYGEEITL